MTRRRHEIPAVLAGAALSLLAACAGSGVGLDEQGRPMRDSGDGGSADGGKLGSGTGELAGFQSTIFGPICADRCHVGATAPKGLLLDTAENSHKHLVGVASDEVPALLRVSPGNPDESYLIVKLIPTDSRRVGERMPRNGPVYLDETALTSLRAWIARGAPAD